ncbi:sugar lactone lactonase YvrE [Actinoplanes tereljensis]|uniref:Strictosidine synthase n=1 Tax=Paractinoplanes tereljensis TaxID=571912 RepID=A0A919NQW3_9ACTN|nr:SMP-30/gluconolactonase/LRE family protein [Actinoplanes tereljensis]GIF22678.1 strictosidine synthase [Actinoplanes tereljensis]
MDLRVFPLPSFGAEDVVVAADGRVLTGTEDGVIWWIDPESSEIGQVLTTGGRPLGLEFLPDGRLLICDARLGLLAADLKGRVETLVDTVGGERMRFCNNAAVAKDGTIYFSDSSTVHPIDRWKAEVVELTRTGRLLRRTPDGEVTVLVDGLSFANGVALADDESFVVVAETAERRLTRHHLGTGKTDVFQAGLPGYPDNISTGSDGLIWITVASPRDPVVEGLQRGPLWLRRQVTRIPEKLQPAPKRTVRVQAYGRDGVLKKDLDLKTERFHMVTGVREHAGQVWLGSLHEPAVAVLTNSGA